MDRHELERGSSSTEAAIIAPALFLVLGRSSPLVATRSASNP